MNHDDPTIQWLLKAGDASVRTFTLIDLLDAPPDAPEVGAARAQIPRSPRIRSLLAGQGAGRRRSGQSLAVHTGGFGVHPYKKWDGAHWRLVSLVELGIPPHNRRARAAADQVLCWLTGESHRRSIRRINGLTRRCASQEGNALAACSRLGLTGDPRVQQLAHSLLEWQWPDGGWNCDKEERAHHSSFYESLAPLWGLIEYHRATGDATCLSAAQRTAELFLRHRLFRSDKTGKVIDPKWLQLHYPLYWHYDILQGLLILSRLGPLTDPRLDEALNTLAAKRLPDGAWRPEGYFWNRPGRRTSNVEVVDWGRGEPNTMITLNALRVLKAAGRL
ncbi:MAG TPA: hypothetical protein VJG32_09950 [Anaerolineae bacterium]|nr:hypothetical protein [Anaerolineae bacterium]